MEEGMDKRDIANISVLLQEIADHDLQIQADPSFTHLRLWPKENITQELRQQITALKPEFLAYIEDYEERMAIIEFDG